MSNVLTSSAKLSLISFFFFAFVSCKNSPAGAEQAEDSIKTNDSAINAGNKLRVFAPPVLKIGKSVDYENKDVLGSSIFTPDDTMFVYYLFQQNKFDLEKLNLRFYRVQENGVDLLESVLIDVDPQANAISDSFEMHKVYNEFGKGQFEMQFLHQDSIIAARSFLLL